MAHALRHDAPDLVPAIRGSRGPHPILRARRVALADGRTSNDDPAQRRNTAWSLPQALHDGRPGTRSRYLFALTPRVATPTVVVSEPEGQDLCYGVVACVQPPLRMQRRA